MYTDHRLAGIRRGDLLAYASRQADATRVQALRRAQRRMRRAERRLIQAQVGVLAAREEMATRGQHVPRPYSYAGSWPGA